MHTCRSAWVAVLQARVKFRTRGACRSVNEKGMRTALKPRAARRVTDVAKSRLRLVLPRNRPSSIVTLLSNPPQTTPLRARGFPLPARTRPFLIVRGWLTSEMDSVDADEEDCSKVTIQYQALALLTLHNQLRKKVTGPKTMALDDEMRHRSNWQSR